MLKFFQIKYFDVDTHGAFDSGSVYFISECQGLVKNQTFLLECGKVIFIARLGEEPEYKLCQ